MDIEIQKIQELLDMGFIHEEEFDRRKGEIMASFNHSITSKDNNDTSNNSQSYGFVGFDPSQIVDSPPQYIPSQNTSPQYIPPQYTPSEYIPPQYTPSQHTSPEYIPSQYIPPQYTPSEYIPPQYTPSGYVPPQYTPSQYIPAQYTPSEYNPPQYDSSQYTTSLPTSEPSQSPRLSHSRVTPTHQPVDYNSTKKDPVDREKFLQENKLEEGKNEYIVYGPKVDGIVLYYITRSGIIQTPVIPKPFYAKNIFGLFDLPSVEKSTNYYLQSIFDKKVTYSVSTPEQIPAGQYYVKEKRMFLMRETPMITDTSLKSHNFKPFPPESQYSSLSLYYPVVSYGFGNCTSYDVFTNSMMEPNLTKVTIIDNNYMKSFPEKTTVGQLRIALQGSAASFSSVNRNKTFDRDDQILPDGIYRIIRPFTTFTTSSVVYKKYEHTVAYKEQSAPPIKIKKDPPPPEPHHIIRSSVPSESIIAGLSSYINKPTPGVHKSMHFFHRARFLQINNRSIGSVTDRLRKGLCVITGIPVGPGQIMTKDYYDEILHSLCEAMKETDDWEKLLLKEEPLPEENEQQNEYMPAERKESQPKKVDKFAYLPPQIFKDDFSKIIPLRPQLKRYLDALIAT